MKSGIECIMTGCNLVVPSEGRWCHGDLHMVGMCFVFNACLHKGETLWFYKSDIPDTVGTDPEQLGARCIILDQPFYFERRGVIVFDAVFHSRLNEAAKIYLGNQLKEKQDAKETNPADGGGFFSRFLRSSRR